MGQAKQRGTFEERKAAAIARNEVEAERKLLEYKERQGRKKPVVAGSGAGRVAIITAMARASSSIYELRTPEDLARRR